jgi:hypothetical protein
MTVGPSFSSSAASNAKMAAPVATLLNADGVRLTGTMQSNKEQADRRKCDMDLTILPDGPVVRISEDCGDLTRGCTLNSGALEQTVVAVQNRLPGPKC